MSNELRLHARITVSKSGVYTGAQCNATFDLGTAPADIAQSLQRQTIGITTESLDLGDLTSCSLIYIENFDPTNFVLVRSGNVAADDNDFLAVILPGECVLLPPDDDALPLKLRADTAPADIGFLALPS